MRELSLFTGAGGGLLGSLLLGHTFVGYVERNDYCQRVIAQRIQDGHLPNAPIFGDIKAFLSEGWAGVYAGMVDIVSAGFPCQPWSNAGHKQGEQDNRNLWPETCAVLRAVRPRFVLLENVPPLLAHAYFGTVLGDLAALGYDARWGVVGASDAGAPHGRKRVWVVAYADEGDGSPRVGLQQDDGGQVQYGGGRQGPAAQWWSVEAESAVSGVASRRADRVDRIGALGNMQIPAVVRLAWETLNSA